MESLHHVEGGSSLSSRQELLLSSLEQRVNHLCEQILHCENILSRIRGTGKQWAIDADDSIRHLCGNKKEISQEEVQLLAHNLRKKERELRQKITRESIGSVGSQPVVVQTFSSIESFRRYMTDLVAKSALSEEEKKEALDFVASLRMVEASILPFAQRVAFWMKQKGDLFIQKLLGHQKALDIALFDVLETGKKDPVSELCLLVALGANINAQKDGRTLLHEACGSRGSLSLIEMLIELGADVNARDILNKTPIFFALGVGSPSLVELLLKAHADLTCVDTLGYTPLLHAISTEREEMVSLLLQAKAPLEGRTDEGYDLWALAEEIGNNKIIEIVNQLPAARLRVPSTSEQRSLQTYLVGLLGAKNLSTEEKEIFHQHIRGWANSATSVDMLAEQAAHFFKERGPSFIRKLFGWGDVTIPDPRSGMTPISQVIKKNGRYSSEKIRLYKALGASLEERDSEGCALIHHAALMGSEGVVRTLHALGMSLEVKDHRGRTPLHLVAQSGQVAMIRLLYELGADLYSKDQDQFTPFLLSAFDSKAEASRAFISLGYDIDKGVLERGHSPLVYALLRKNMDLASRLEQLGADREQALEIVQKKKLAHFWSIGGGEAITTFLGSTYRLEYEGNFSESAFQWLVELLKKSQSTVPVGVITKEEFSQLEQSVGFIQDLIQKKDQQAVSSLLVQRIHEGAYVPILTGTPDHVISVLFGNDKMYVLNRGAGRDDRYAVVCYPFPKERVSLEMIQELQKRFASFDQMKSFFSVLDETFGLILRGVLEDECVVLKPQRVGNCSFANTMPLILVLLSLIRTKQDPDPTSRWSSAREAFRLLMAQGRIDQVNETLGVMHHGLPDALFCPIEARLEAGKPRLMPEVRGDLLHAIATKRDELSHQDEMRGLPSMEKEGLYTFLEERIAADPWMVDLSKEELRKDLRAIFQSSSSLDAFVVKTAKWIKEKGPERIQFFFGCRDVNEPIYRTGHVPIFELLDHSYPASLFELKLLVALGADIHQTNKEGKTVLHEACQRTHMIPMIEQLF